MSRLALVRVPPAAMRDRLVAGLTLLDRAVRVTRAAAGEPPVVACDGAEEQRAAVAVPSAPTVRNSAEALADLEGRPLLVVFGEMVVDRRVVAALASDSCGTDELVTADTDTGPSHTYAVGAALAATLTAADLASLAAFRGWTASRTVRTIHPAFDTSTFAFEVTDEASARPAITALFQACIKPVDGIVSRNINRRFSIPLSRLLVNTSVTPNQVTGLCLVIAVVAALVALRGDPFALALAGLLFQTNSVLDGVDGELARVKWAFSPLGELLDSVGDDLANFSYFGAMVYVAWTHGELALAAMGGIGLTVWALYLVFLHLSLRGTKRGDVMIVSEQAMQSSGGFWARAIEIGRLLLRRDGFVFLAFLFAIAGHATYILPVVLVGGSSTFLFAVRETLRRVTSG